MTSTGFHATEMWRDMIGILHEQVSINLINQEPDWNKAVHESRNLV